MATISRNPYHDRAILHQLKQNNHFCNKLIFFLVTVHLKCIFITLIYQMKNVFQFLPLFLLTYFYGLSQGQSPLLQQRAPQLQTSKKIWLYLPQSYESEVTKKYPVIYTHDAQNLFDDKTAYAGEEWHIDEL